MVSWYIFFLPETSACEVASAICKNLKITNLIVTTKTSNIIIGVQLIRSITSINTIISWKFWNENAVLVLAGDYLGGCFQTGSTCVYWQLACLAVPAPVRTLLSTDKLVFVPASEHGRPFSGFSYYCICIKYHLKTKLKKLENIIVKFPWKYTN